MDSSEILSLLLSSSRQVLEAAIHNATIIYLRGCLLANLHDLDRNGGSNLFTTFLSSHGACLYHETADIVCQEQWEILP